MADIDIERKGPGAWPWIIGLILLGLLAWLLVGFFNDDSAIEAPMVDVVDPAPVATVPSLAGADSAAVPAAVQQYLAACAPREPAAMTLDHAYTSSCIQSLLDGVDAVMQRPDLVGVDVQALMQDARQRAQQLAQSQAAATDHASMTGDAFEAIAAVLNGIQDARYPELDAQATQVAETARSVQPGGNLLDQREAVQRFFSQAGQVLSGIASGSGGGA